MNYKQRFKDMPVDTSWTYEEDREWFIRECSNLAFGENTIEGREKFQADIDRTHKIFQEFVLKRRPQLDIEKVATGEYWQAVTAKELNLVDELATSDELISTLISTANIFKVKKNIKRSIYKNFFKKAAVILDHFKVH